MWEFACKRSFTNLDQTLFTCKQVPSEDETIATKKAAPNIRARPLCFQSTITDNRAAINYSLLTIHCSF